MPPFIHPAAHVLGDVTLGGRVSVWPTAVIRGDTAPIAVGDDSNVQDGAVLHVDRGVPCTIGKRVAIGHRAVVHGATVHDDCLIGIGASAGGVALVVLVVFFFVQRAGEARRDDERRRRR